MPNEWSGVACLLARETANHSPFFEEHLSSFLIPYQLTIISPLLLTEQVPALAATLKSLRSRLVPSAGEEKGGGLEPNGGKWDGGDDSWRDRKQVSLVKRW